MLPVCLFKWKKVAKIWGSTEANVEKLLNHLYEKELMGDSEYKGQRKFTRSIPMARFFEFDLN